MKQKIAYRTEPRTEPTLAEGLTRGRARIRLLCGWGDRESGPRAATSDHPQLCSLEQKSLRARGGAPVVRARRRTGRSAAPRPDPARGPPGAPPGRHEDTFEFLRSRLT